MSQIIRRIKTKAATIDPSWFLGATLSGITFSDPCWWVFAFSSGASISVECLWRLLDQSSILRTSEDHRQKFGLPAPVDAASHASQLLVGDIVSQFSVREDSLDLLFQFSRGHRLEILPTSAGYEAWQIVTSSGQHVIAQGGGQLSMYTDEKT